MELNPRQIAESDPFYWAWLNQIVIDGRPFSKDGREYQIEMMRPITGDGKVKQNEVIKKGSQTGATMGKAIEIAHGASHGHYSQGIIYFFPSKTAVEEFSGSRFKPLLKDNDFLSAYCNDINSVYTRRIGKTNVSFHGCSGTTVIGGIAKDSTSVRSTPADWILLDERDLFDDEMASQVNQRLGNSTIRRRSDMGTPKLPDDGIDRLYGKSDMRRWQIPCPSCRRHTCLETEFPQCIKIADGRGFPICIHCGAEINRSDGVWVPDSPSKETVGYWCSQLLNPNRPLDQAVREFDDPEEYDTTEAEFQRTVMGCAFARAEDVLRETEVLQCCTNDQMAYSHNGPCAMGFDVGYPLIHAVIGHRIGNDRYRLVRMARVKSWDELHDLAQRYNVKSTVGDAMPESHKIREWAKSEAASGNTVYPCYYSDTLKTFDKWSTDNIVTVNRTEIFDSSHRLITSPGKLLLPRRCQEVNIFAHQYCQTAKFLETDSRGNATYRYKKIGDRQDHYRSSTNYFALACKKVGTPKTERQKQKIVSQDMGYSL